MVSQSTATWILHELETNSDYVSKFVNEYLPKECKGLIESNPRNYGVAAVAGGLMLGPLGLLAAPFLLHATKAASESVATTIRPATEEDVKLVMEKAMEGISSSLDVVFPSSIYSVHEASKILHGCVDEDALTESRVQELKDIVEPFIYGGTPFYKSLEKALKLFRCTKYQDHKKLLFVVSDGEPSDPKNSDLFSQLRAVDVTVVGCYIKRSTQVEPRRLFSEANDSWEPGAKLLFDLSSKITTQLIPRTIYIKNDWEIESTYNETRLFLQVNHPDIMKDACSLARNVVCCQDALADALVKISLDIYINQSTDNFGAPDQEPGTCYANASAAVLHLSMKRILGREGGYPEFKDLRRDLIARFGTSGAKTFEVLQSVCPQYRLHCKKVSTQEAMAAITEKRPVVAKFRFSKDEWDIFRKFYDNNKTGILTRKELDINKRPKGVKTLGHAVVLTSYNSECLLLMNSSGTSWGDNGFFRVENAEVLGLKFIDVFWKKDKLTRGEKEFYKKYGAEVAKQSIDSLKGLQSMTYQCPCCKQESKVTEYSGTLERAKCPKCNREFKSNEEGNILALNMYLTSLSR